MNFTKVSFRPIKRLKLIGSWFPERSENLLFQRRQETIQQSPLQYCFRYISILFYELHLGNDHDGPDVLSW